MVVSWHILGEVNGGVSVVPVFGGRLNAFLLAHHWTHARPLKACAGGKTIGTTTTAES
jgi:hypothetical protein